MMVTIACAKLASPELRGILLSPPPISTQGHWDHSWALLCPALCEFWRPKLRPSQLYTRSQVYLPSPPGNILHSPINQAGEKKNNNILPHGVEVRSQKQGWPGCFACLLVWRAFPSTPCLFPGGGGYGQQFLLTLTCRSTTLFLLSSYSFCVSLASSAFLSLIKT